ncbi:MAG TPA: beta-propeller domain-containing protein [Acidimicrobiales bacterium]|nr:beta-propeller domain-containing protein [Acidimicrobiales bacterium]
MASQLGGPAEPDVVETDGQVMAIVRDQPAGLQVVDVGASPPQLDGFVALPDLGSPYGLFLVGHDAVVLGTGLPPRAGSVVPVAGGYETTNVVVVSLVVPTQPSVLRTSSFRGALEGARLIGGRVVMVLTSWPAALYANGTASERACSATTGPNLLPALGTITLASLDPTSVAPAAEVTVRGDATYVYASATIVYAAGTSPLDWPCSPFAMARAAIVACCAQGPGVACPMRTPAIVGRTPTPETAIYGFDVSAPASPHYLGSAEVAGTLVGEASMSEYDGYLRVVTTVRSSMPGPVAQRVAIPLAESVVTTLKPEKGAFVEAGSLRGFADGAPIYAVSFEGPYGYVASYGALSLLDLSSPSAPALAGKVITGDYLSLLEPLGNGLVAGLGEAAQSTASGSTTNGTVPGASSGESLVLDMFGVSSPASPDLVSSKALGAGATSLALGDPQAFLWSPEAGVIAFPVEGPVSQGPFGPLDVWSVGQGGELSLVGQLQQPGSAQIERAVVLGADVYSVSQKGLMVSAGSTLALVAWVPFSDSSA